MLIVHSNLNSGGFIELHEISVPAGCTPATADPKPYFLQYCDYFIEAGKKTGHEFTAPHRLANMLQEAGFVDISVKWQNWPVGPWAKGKKNKQIGQWWAEDLKEVTGGSGALYTRVLGWSQEQFEVFAANIKKEIDGRKRHMWIAMSVPYQFARRTLTDVSSQVFCERSQTVNCYHSNICCSSRRDSHSSKH